MTIKNLLFIIIFQCFDQAASRILLERRMLR